MTKKLLFFFFLVCFLQFSFWPAFWGVRETPAFILAFLVILSGRISFRQSWFWFLGGGILASYFSSWPSVAEIFFFVAVNGMLFLIEKIFLWQRINVWLEIILLSFSKIFFDSFQWLLKKIFLYLDFFDWRYQQEFEFKNYLFNLFIFVFIGLCFYFLLAKKNDLPRRNGLEYYS